ncbi:hypothetical protein pkur_cds_543 [Pandoravirus kuranda]|uniref:Uncharacterized protein n=1 Tax=Pandoravirus kuranda TaxID=3019033 RepID=A0AA95EER2_9VIRU|nr:hypothetical protein pkur_cds_543 [Pandoravirus kuranda]
MGALDDVFVVDEGRPYEPCRSRLLGELLALPQPLVLRGATSKKPQYYIDVTRATLSHARMPIASASFFVDDSITTDKLVVLWGLTHGGNKWHIRIEEASKGRDGQPTYAATIKMAGTVFQHRVVVPSSRPK